MTLYKLKSNLANKIKIVLTSLFTLLMLASSANADQSDSSKVKKVKEITQATIEEVSNKAQYLYLNGDYLQASLLSSQILKSLSKFPSRDTIVLIKWLSDLKLDNNPPREPYIKPTTIDALPGIVELLEVLYEQGNYKMVQVISKKLKGSESKYFQALAFYGANKGAKAIKLLKEIKKTSPLYPLAQIFYGQLLAISSDIDGAIKTLKQIESLVTVNSEPYNRLNLLLGQLYYDKQEFELSESHFIKVSTGSPNYKLATTGKIESKIKNGHCTDAIKIIEQETKKNIFYNDRYFSMMINKARCELTLGKISKATDTAVLAIEDIKEIEKELLSLRVASAKSDKAIDIITNKLIRGTSNLDTTKAVQYTGKILEKNLEIKEAISRYLSLNRMKESFVNLEDDIRKTIESVYDNSGPEESKMLSVRVRIKRIWELQIELQSKVFNSNSDQLTLKQLDSEAKERLINIYSMWERSLARALTDGEKRVLHVFALEGPKGLEFLENTLYSDLLYWITLARDKGKNSKSTPEKIIDDLYQVARNNWIDENAMFPHIEKNLSSDIEEAATILTDLLRLLRHSKKERLGASIKTDAALARIKQLIRKRLTLAILELKAQTNDAIIMVRDINQEIAKGNK